MRSFVVKPNEKSEAKSRVEVKSLELRSLYTIEGRYEICFPFMTLGFLHHMLPYQVNEFTIQSNFLKLRYNIGGIEYFKTRVGMSGLIRVNDK